VAAARLQLVKIGDSALTGEIPAASRGVGNRKGRPLPHTGLGNVINPQRGLGLSPGQKHELSLF